MPVIHIPYNPDLLGVRCMVNDVRYSEAAGGLTMQLFLPKEPKTPHEMPDFPLLVFVRGSGWGLQERWGYAPMLGYLAMRGYVVAAVYHRNALDGYPFPGYLQDVKTGIRFLRKNAERFHIQPDRVGILGDSSGGNTALLVGLTGDDPAFETEEYAGYSDSVKAVVSYYAPTDMETFYDEEKTGKLLRGEIPCSTDLERLVLSVSGGKKETLKAMSPVNYVDTCKAIPPMLLMHGNRDEVVPYAQAEEFYEKLRPYQKDLNLYCVDGALHGDNFWSDRVLDLTCDFLKERL